MVIESFSYHWLHLHKCNLIEKQNMEYIIVLLRLVNVYILNIKLQNIDKYTRIFTYQLIMLTKKLTIMLSWSEL